MNIILHDNKSAAEFLFQHHDARAGYDHEWGDEYYGDYVPLWTVWLEAAGFIK